MDIFNEIDLFIEEKEVANFLGYKYSEPEEGILQRIKEEIEKSYRYIEPAVYHKKIGIQCIEDDKVLLENDITFQGRFIAEKLNGCNYVVAAVTTLGGKIDKIIDEAFDSDDFLRGSIIDSIGTVAIGYANKIFWNKMIDGIRESNSGMTSMLSPGSKGWQVQEQKKIFQCMGDGFTAVTLTDSYLMLPMKSTSAVYGFGKNIGIGRLGHVCSECSMKYCSYKSKILS